MLGCCRAGPGETEARQENMARVHRDQPAKEKNSGSLTPQQTLCSEHGLWDPLKLPLFPETLMGPLSWGRPGLDKMLFE